MHNIIIGLQNVIPMNINPRKKVIFPSICVEGNVKEIVQYRAKFPSVSEKYT